MSRPVATETRQRRRHLAWRRIRRHFSARTALLLFLGAILWAGDTGLAQNPPQQTAQSNRAVAGPSVVADLEAASPNADDAQNTTPFNIDVEQLTSPAGLSSTLKVMLLLTVLSLAPSILIMSTCFIRFIIVLGLLRQALGTQQLPPNQVIISLCLFLTFLVMGPVWHEAYEQGLRPYTDPQPGEVQPDLQTAIKNTVRPLRGFMIDQIEMAGNSDAVWMFLEFQRPGPDSPDAGDYKLPEDYKDVDLTVLLPAYMMSELKTAFIIGFQLYLPFLVIDMVIASVLISMGMMMLPPVLISLPFKLLLFVMIDGWYLTVGMLLESVRPFG